MPERPDLEYLVPRLHAGLAGQRIDAVLVRSPVLLRLLVVGNAEELLEGRRVERVSRRGHFVVFTLDGPHDLVVAPMLAGRFSLVPAGKRLRKSEGFVLGFGETQLRYRDDVQMGKIYVVPRERPDKVPGLAAIGVDVLSEAFTFERFEALASKRRDQVKVFLKDKSQLDALGNAYADEVLFAAGIHPKARVRSLDEAQLRSLHGAIVSVLTEARDEVARREPELDEKVRDFLKVRNRKGQPCPACGTTIRAAGVHGFDAFFCPKCQPDPNKRAFIDWNKLP